MTLPLTPFVPQKFLHSRQSATSANANAAIAATTEIYRNFLYFTHYSSLITISLGQGKGRTPQYQRTFLHIKGLTAL